MKSHSRHHEPVHHESRHAQEDSDVEDQYSESISLLSINKMAYTLPVASSNSSQRMAQTYLFNPSSFNNVSRGTTASIILNTGNQYLFAPTSTVQFRVSFSNVDPARKLCWAWGDSFGAAGGATATSKSGASAANIFSESTIISRSGELIQRNLHCNVLAANMNVFEKGVGGEYANAAAGGASWMAEPNGVASTVVAPYGAFVYPIYDCAQAVTFSLPLSKLLTFFSNSAPIPAVLASGAKLTLAFEDFLQAMVFYTCTTVAVGGAPPTGPFTLVNPVTTNVVPFQVAVSDMQLLLDTTTIYDSSQQLINAASSSLQSSGISYPYWNTYQSRYTLNSTSNTLDIMVSAAKLRCMILSFRKPYVAGVSADNMARLPLVGGGALGSSIFYGGAQSVGLLGDNSSIRVRCGAEILQLTPIRNAGQLYQSTFTALTSVKNGLAVDIDPLHNEGKSLDMAIGYSDWYYGSGGTTIALDLERSANLSVSGLSVNNSRQLSIELQNLNAGGGAGESILLDVFIIYMSNCAVTVENCIVDR
jgi:hypothetical protein